MEKKNKYKSVHLLVPEDFYWELKTRAMNNLIPVTKYILEATGDRMMNGSVRCIGCNCASRDTKDDQKGVANIQQTKIGNNDEFRKKLEEFINRYTELTKLIQTKKIGNGHHSGEEKDREI